MRAVVTGCAGFVGSTLCDRLLDRGDHVVGIDAFTPYYGREEKERAFTPAVERGLQLVEGDLRTVDLVSVVEGADVVFHQAAQPGVRLSWAEFDTYASNNILATQRLLEAARTARVPRLVYASSSSIYGQRARYPTAEEELPAPHSPYGVTKLAGEHLCRVYSENWGLPTAVLRYFTVYGPRQRPDMAIRRLLDAGLHGTAFPLFGDGKAIRDFTFVDDVVTANVLAADADLAPGTTVNVGGGGEIAMADLVRVAEEALGREIEVEWLPEQAGDVLRTGADIGRARELLGYEPSVTVPEGVERQLAWQRAL
jgi:nucleoside-diphosphate-sugar epimerase